MYTIERKNISLISKLLLLALILTLGVALAKAEWEAPSAPATVDNSLAPVNIGADSQIKGSNLTVNNLGADYMVLGSYMVLVGTDEEVTCDASREGTLQYLKTVVAGPGADNCLQFCQPSSSGFEWINLACTSG